MSTAIKVLYWVVTHGGRNTLGLEKQSQSQETVEHKVVPDSEISKFQKGSNFPKPKSDYFISLKLT